MGNGNIVPFKCPYLNWTNRYNATGLHVPQRFEALAKANDCGNIWGVVCPLYQKEGHKCKAERPENQKDDDTCGYIAN